MMTPEMILLAVLTNSPLMFDVTNIDTSEAFCLAQNIYHESALESLAGQFAVAHTTNNRVNDTRYPDTFCNVVKQKTKVAESRYVCQFSWYCDDLPDEVQLYGNNGEYYVMNVEAFEAATVIATMVMTGMSSDNTRGATHFYNSGLASPNWANYYAHTVTYGGHSFHIREKGSLK